VQVTKMAGPSHSGGSGPIITKAIYTKPISQKRVYNLGSSLTPCLVYIGSGSAPGTPTKTFTLSHVTTEGSPGRPQLGGKIAISPLKSPSKIVCACILQVKTSGQQGGVKPLSMPMSTMQPISVPGSKFHYVRLVTPVSTHTTQGLPAKPVSSTPQLRPPIPIAPAQRQVVVARLGAPSPHLVSGGGSVVSPVVGPMVNRGQTPHRLIMPASSLPLRPSLPGLPPGTLLTPAAGYTMMPAQYITQLQQAQPCVSVSISKLAPLAAAASVPSTQTRIPVNGITTTDSASRPRKPCNCTKSQCLKLYCECFANGEFCYNCNCRNCSNNLVHESDRQRAIKSCLDRNPEAFRPKIGKGKEGEAERRHNKGCHCKRSGCLKNYCECYEAKIMCSSMCKCVGCKNFEESPERKTLMHLADAAEVRVLQQTAAKTKLSSQISDLPTRPPANGTGERLPFNFVTREVAEATCDCLLTVVDEVLGAGETRAVAERRVLQEFGRCLQQIINSAGKVRGEMCFCKC
uniref:CRC domain-containing protein n=1 Tax=Petromyzon marinus TaxID=7757 RepID=S4RAD8_PETMA